MSIEKIKECPKCGINLLATPDEIENEICISCADGSEELESFKKKEQYEDPVNPEEE